MTRDWIELSASTPLAVDNFIDGRVPSGRGEPIDKYGPRDGRLLLHYQAASAEQVTDAVCVARRSLDDGRWSLRSATQRKDALLKLAILIEQQAEIFALLESIDVGKPIYDSLTFDVPAAIAALRATAELSDKATAKFYGADASSLSYQLRRPIGTVAGIIGWNFPLLQAVSKLAPALAMGNSLVLKPSELTGLSAGRLAALALESGVPPGVFNVVQGGHAVGSALAFHAGIDMISFTGSTRTGKSLLIAAGESNMKRLVLECGGKAPTLVFDDAPNLEAVADAVVAKAFWNQGQVCTAGSRLLVQGSIAARLLELVTERTAALTLGDPLLETTRYAALISRAHCKKVRTFIERGTKQGARLAFQSGASEPVPGGFYLPPTILDQVSSQQCVAQEEIFGPVLCVSSFRDEREAIKLANETIYGLSATIWTRDPGRAHRLAQGIRAGWIVVNATDNPKGGPSEGTMSVGGHKQSGIGVEGGVEGLEAYCSHSAVQVFV